MAHLKLSLSEFSCETMLEAEGRSRTAESREKSPSISVMRSLRSSSSPCKFDKRSHQLYVETLFKFLATIKPVFFGHLLCGFGADVCELTTLHGLPIPISNSNFQSNYHRAFNTGYWSMEYIQVVIVHWRCSLSFFK